MIIARVYDQLSSLTSKQFYSLAVLLLSIPFFILFRSIALQPSQRLFDTTDYPLQVWVVSSTLENFKSGFTNGLFFGNAFFPEKSALLFSDLLLSVAVFALPFSFLVSNPIVLLNIGLLCTFLLTIVSVLFFLRQISTSRLIQFVGAFFLLYSPFFFSQVSHAQLLSTWPVFFGLGLLQSKKWKVRNAILFSVLFFIQFISSVYLAVLMLSVFGIHSLSRLLFEREKGKVSVQTGFQVFCCVICILPILLSYQQIQHTYSVTRDPGEYVDYASQVSDYFFWRKDSLIAQLPVFSSYVERNHHDSGEPVSIPTITLLLLAVVGVKNHKRKQLVFFCVCLIGIGFIFSLGPRFSFNGTYMGTPLPYAVVLKVTSALDFFRATSRWSFLLYLGCALLAVLGVERLFKNTTLHRKIVITLLMVLAYTFETFPVRSQAFVISPLDSTPILTKLCKKDPQVLLEYPVFFYNDYSRTRLEPSYSSLLMVDALTHRCKLVNGYSGVLPPDLLLLDTNLTEAVGQNDREKFFFALQRKNITAVRLHLTILSASDTQRLLDWLSSNNQVQLHYTDTETVIVTISSSP